MNTPDNMHFFLVFFFSRVNTPDHVHVLHTREKREAPIAPWIQTHSFCVPIYILLYTYIHRYIYIYVGIHMRIYIRHKNYLYESLNNQ